MFSNCDKMFKLYHFSIYLVFNCNITDDNREIIDGRKKYFKVKFIFSFTEGYATEKTRKARLRDQIKITRDIISNKFSS